MLQHEMHPNAARIDASYAFELNWNLSGTAYSRCAQGDDESRASEADEGPCVRGWNLCAEQREAKERYSERRCGG